MDIKLKCASCEGTGLYNGFVEPKGTYRICKVCNGNGYTPIPEHMIFKGKTTPSDVKMIRVKTTTLCNTKLDSDIPYEEWLKK